ncbi:MAG: hypothetical protein LLG01_07805 [Planctomycetaceae bacterium]|nr:hypothetical protein [Planctomycetaceae bacterium]
MATRNRQSDAPAGPGIWIVSFSDCMTNLMTFFVLLVSFASFDKAAMSRLGTVFESVSKPSIFGEHKPPGGSLLPPPPSNDVTEKGSEAPTDRPAELTVSPQESPDTDLQAARQEISLPIEKLFWGNGAALQPAGRQTLAAIAPYLAKIPRTVVVEVGSAAQMNRAAAIVACFTQTHRLPVEQFCICAPTRRASSAAGDYVKLIVLAKEVCP